MKRRHPSCVLAASWAATVLGCAPGPPTAPVIEQRVVVQAVLDPENGEQIIFVTRTQDGVSVPAPATTANAFDPIVRTGGIPINDARVVIFGPGSDSIVAVEDRSLRTDGTGGGVYRVLSRAVASTATTVPAGILRIASGARYRLRVDSHLGTVHGTTLMPRFNRVVSAAQRTFNLDMDSLRRPSVADDGAGPAAYIMLHRVNGVANRAWNAGNSSTLLLAPSPMDNDPTWSFGFSRENIRPGVVQRFLVIAVDSNYYAYNRWGYDPFGHDAQGNRLEGGVGIFGAVAAVSDDNLDLVANRENAIEGDWAPTVVTKDLPAALRLYESPRFPGPTKSAGLHLYGTARMPNGAIYMVDASLIGETLQLEFTLENSSLVKRVAGTLGDGGLTLNVVGSALRIRYENRSTTP